MTGPLSGLRVVDVSMGAVGPWCGSLLGQLGAKVIKIEGPGNGDFLHRIKPFKNGGSTAYIAMNFNKKHAVIDFKDEKDRAFAYELIGNADVFIENFRPGVADRVGMGYSVLSELNPRLVYASASGFGSKGPMAHIGATDPHVQAFCGASSVTGELGADRQLWRWFGHFDCTTAMAMLEGILAALLERETTGKGKYVVITMIEASLALQRVRMAEHLFGTKVGPMGTATSYLVPDQAFETLDRPLAVTASSPREWRSLCAAIGKPELTDDKRFCRNRDRIRNRDALVAVLQAVFKTASAGFWLDRLQKHHVPAALFSTFDEYRHDERYRALGMPKTFETKAWGTVLAAGLPWHFDETPGAQFPGGKSDANDEEIRERRWDAWSD